MLDYKLNGSECLGIEFGSTRIKAVLIDKKCKTLASGSFDWENRFENGFWTYHYDDIETGLQEAYKSLNENCEKKYGEKIKSLSSIGISAMMHGYLPLDINGEPLCEFRTWRNTTTARAASELTKLFSFNIPQRWSIAHLYQAILNGEKHIDKIKYLTTLAGYVHRKLSGQNALGIGEASGMFPIDSSKCRYDESMIYAFSQLDEVKKCGINIKEILPRILLAGDNAGYLTKDGALFLDPSGTLSEGAVMCPPEGDAGTGMVATNSIAVKTGNVSAGTSIFSMVVLEKQLSKVYEEIDMVTTPTGKPVAMVHCNNCCTDLDYWVRVLGEFTGLCDMNISKSKLYDLVYQAALNGDKNCGGVVAYNYFSGEPVTKLSDGRPLFARSKDADFTFSNFARSLVYSTFATLKIGMEILEKENVSIDRLMGHGGLFKTEYVGQKLLAGALNTPICVMETAGEGGAWGIAVLACYARYAGSISLDEYLDKYAFAGMKSVCETPDVADYNGFDEYMKLYKKGIAVEKAAAENI